MVCIGALVTSIIQSFSATTVMVVGFVNSGLMTLRQAIWIIMGANIDTSDCMKYSQIMTDINRVSNHMMNIVEVFYKNKFSFCIE